MNALWIHWVVLSWVANKNFGRVIDSFEQKLATILCARLVFDEIPDWMLCPENDWSAFVHVKKQMDSNFNAFQNIIVDFKGRKKNFDPDMLACDTVFVFRFWFCLFPLYGYELMAWNLYKRELANCTLESCRNRIFWYSRVDKARWKQPDAGTCFGEDDCLYKFCDFSPPISHFFVI